MGTTTHTTYTTHTTHTTRIISIAAPDPQRPTRPSFSGWSRKAGETPETFTGVATVPGSHRWPGLTAGQVSPMARSHR